MDAPGLKPSDGDAETIRLQAEEHPLIEDTPPSTPAEHCLRLMHLRAYDEAVEHATGRDVLDVGCNTGYGTVRFVPVARRVVGVDVSPRAIEAALDRAGDGRPEFILSGGLELPFPDGSFDLVTSFQVLEHVSDPLVFLRELTRVTRPGGQVILTTPNAATRLYPGMKPWNRFHVHEYVAPELQALLEGVFAGVRVLGMFGSPELYQTEIRRVDAARRRIRRKEEAEAKREMAAAEAASRRAVAAAARPTRPPRALPIRVARAVLPDPFRAWLRSIMSGSKRAVQPQAVPAASPTHRPVAPSADPPSPGMETFLRFSVDDLWYLDTDLDRSMDLLAVCDV